MTYFSAGLRVVDIRDPFKPIEVGHYLPSATENTRYTEQKGPLQGQNLEKSPLTNDVAIDRRGYIYISDRAGTGVHIVKLKGKLADIAAYPDSPSSHREREEAVERPEYGGSRAGPSRGCRRSRTFAPNQPIFTW